jgi:hypothetical protein
MARRGGFLHDLADSLSPWRTADLGCVALRSSCGDETGRTLTAAEQQHLREKKAAEDAKAESMQQSVELIEMIQAAIGRREAMLRAMGEDPGLPGDGGPQVEAALAAARRAHIGRLALEELTDQALAREELAPADLIAARVDMSELLPQRATDVRYAQTTEAAIARGISLSSLTGAPRGAPVEASNASSSYYDGSDALGRPPYGGPTAAGVASPAGGRTLELSASDGESYSSYSSSSSQASQEEGDSGAAAGRPQAGVATRGAGDGGDPPSAGACVGTVFGSSVFGSVFDPARATPAVPPAATLAPTATQRGAGGAGARAAPRPPVAPRVARPAADDDEYSYYDDDEEGQGAAGL